MRLTKTKVKLSLIPRQTLGPQQLLHKKYKRKIQHSVVKIKGRRKKTKVQNQGEKSKKNSGKSEARTEILDTRVQKGKHDSITNFYNKKSTRTAKTPRPPGSFFFANSSNRASSFRQQQDRSRNEERAKSAYNKCKQINK